MARLSSLSSLPCIRLLVLGDSGVGKTSLIQSLLLLSSTSPSPSSSSSPSSPSLPPPSLSSSSVSWTIGCQPETLLLPPLSGGSGGGLFVEFFDVGGHRKYAGSRSMFYHGVDGLLLVFDLGNRESYRNIAKWMKELVEVDRDTNIQEEWGGRGGKGGGGGGKGGRGLAALPVLVVGNKADTAGGGGNGGGRSYDCLKDYGLDLIVTSATQQKGRDSNLQLLTPFLQQVLDRKERGEGTGGPQQPLQSSLQYPGNAAKALLHGGVAAVYQRKSGGGGSGGGGRLGGWGGGSDRVNGIEDEEEEREDDGLTIDMDQLETLSHPITSSTPSSSSLTSTPSSASSSSSLSRFLPTRLLSLGSDKRKDNRDDRSRV